MMDRILGRSTGVYERPEEVPDAGLTAQDLRLEPGETLPPELAPMAPVETMELVGTVPSSDQLRLDVPELLNPYETSPYGPRHDYMMLRSIVSRSKEPEWRELLNMLSSPLPGVSDRTHNYMRASLAREYNMLNLVDKHRGFMEQIYGKMIGVQEG